MASWLIKTAIQHGLALAPGGQRLSDWLKSTFSGSLDLGPGAFAEAAGGAEVLLRQLPPDVGEFTAVELGTGWHPVLPVAFFLCGARQIWTFDIVALLRPARLRQVFELVRDQHQRGELARLLPRLRPDRLERIEEALRHVDTEPPERVLARLNIAAVTRDAQATGLPDGCADLLFSRWVLVYISPPVLANILREFRRLAAPRAVMCHWIFCNDQFAYYDRSIGPLNYLRYTARQWRWLDSPLIPQNRLRVSDYRQLVRAAGFMVVDEQNTLAPATVLAGLSLAAEFRDRSAEDLLTTASFMVARPAGARVTP